MPAVEGHRAGYETMKKVEEIVEREGTDAWWAHSAEELLPEGFKCPHCGGTHFHKENLWDALLYVDKTTSIILFPYLYLSHVFQ